MKPANLLISHRGEVKVADLGIMKKLEVEPRKKGLPTTNSFIGTSTYFSPERIDGKEYRLVFLNCGCGCVCEYVGVWVYI